MPKNYASMDFAALQQEEAILYEKKKAGTLTPEEEADLKVVYEEITRHRNQEVALKQREEELRKRQHEKEFEASDDPETNWWFRKAW